MQHSSVEIKSALENGIQHDDMQKQREQSSHSRNLFLKGYKFKKRHFCQNRNSGLFLRMSGCCSISFFHSTLIKVGFESETLDVLNQTNCWILARSEEQEVSLEID
jgi:hypothetical protein